MADTMRDCTDISCHQQLYNEVEALAQQKLKNMLLQSANANLNPVGHFILLFSRHHPDGWFVGAKQCPRYANTAAPIGTTPGPHSWKLHWRAKVYRWPSFVRIGHRYTRGEIPPARNALESHWRLWGMPHLHQFAQRAKDNHLWTCLLSFLVRPPLTKSIRMITLHLSITEVLSRDPKCPMVSKTSGRGLHIYIH